MAADERTAADGGKERVKSNIELLHREITHEIIGAAFRVHNEVGPGWDEEAYHLALLRILETSGLRVESKLGGKLCHGGILADEFQLDILVERKVILELKHLKTGFANSNYVQLINYLKYWEKDLGMLFNFGLDRLRYERVPFSAPTYTFESVGPWDDFGHVERKIAEKVKSAVHEILIDHGFGYGIATCEGLFRAACKANQLALEQPNAFLAIDGFEIGGRTVPGYLVDSRILVLFSAEKDGNSAAMLARLRSYLNWTDSKGGILVNMGKRSVQLRAVIL